jgi:hypothetical protein
MPTRILWPSKGGIGINLVQENIDQRIVVAERPKSNRDHEQYRQNNVRQRSGERGECQASLMPAETIGVDRDRAAPTDAEPPDDDQQESQRPERIEVSQWIERDPPLSLAGIIT